MVLLVDVVVVFRVVVWWSLRSSWSVVVVDGHLGRYGLSSWVQLWRVVLVVVMFVAAARVLEKSSVSGFPGGCEPHCYVKQVAETKTRLSPPAFENLIFDLAAGTDLAAFRTSSESQRGHE